MGVDQTHYVMYGVKVEPGDPEWPSDDEAWDEENKWGAAICGTPDSELDAACDSNMSDPEFYIVGEILASGDHREGISLTEIDISAKRLASINERLESFFGFDSFSKITPGIYAFTNWS